MYYYNESNDSKRNKLRNEYENEEKYFEYVKEYKKDKKDNNDDNDNKDKKDICPTILKCGNVGSSVVIPAGSTAANTFTLASLNLNLHKLCNPVAKLEFTSNFAIGAFVGTIRVQIFKQCGLLPAVAVGPAFLFTLPAPGITAANPFTFFVCDEDFCIDKCCVYTAVATPVGTTAGTLTVNNATISAIATCAHNNCCN